MTEVSEFLQQTPWWVYLIFIYLLLIGVKAARPNVVSLYKLLILPVLFSWMSVETLLSSFVLSPAVISCFVAVLVLLIVVGYVQVSRMDCQVDKPHMLIRVPGTWTTMVVVLLIFGVKYYFGYKMAQDPNVIHDLGFEYLFIVVSSGCTGYFIGKVVAYAVKLYTHDGVDLSAYLPKKSKKEEDDD